MGSVSAISIFGDVPVCWHADEHQPDSSGLEVRASVKAGGKQAVVLLARPKVLPGNWLEPPGELYAIHSRMRQENWKIVLMSVFARTCGCT
jgi:hypothetical protein